MSLRYDRRALSDLDEIYTYIATHDPQAAPRVIGRIRALAEQLLERPLLGRKSDFPSVRVRPVVTFPYVIFYAIKSNDIVILHIRHTARRQPSPAALA